MKLSVFIKSNIEALVLHWETFARSVQPLPPTLSEEELRDWAQHALEAIAEDMETEQTDEEEERRSKGLSTLHQRITEVAHAHATQRLLQGFTIGQIAAEFRALRATVVRLWMRELKDADRDTLVELTRFDQGVDQSLTESINWYSERLERSRHLVMGALGHDLRDPLSAIHAGTEFLLVSGENLDHQQTKTVVRIRNSALRMRKMINDLLDFTRTRLGGSLPLSPEPFDLGDAVHQIVDELRAYHPESSVKLDLQRGGDFEGTWDRARIEETASNLISNALKYGQRGATVTITVRDEGAEIVLAVHNKGDPIPAEMRRPIFDPLVRGGLEERDKRKRDGSLGLGLYITRHIVEAHGGRIELSSSEESGTTFEVRLPRRTSSSDSPNHL